MKNAFAAIIVAWLAIAALGCNKCYQCHNQCEICRRQKADTTLTIEVCSDVLSKQYYELYTDSLISVGWTCTDTASTVNKSVCDGQLAKQTDLFNAEAAGFVCTP
jgi:hypothetical protein